MSIAVTITAGGTPYDVSDYVIRHSIEIDEYLFSPDSLKPNTNKATLVLSRTCPNIDEILAASGDISISIVADGVAAFSGYLTDNFGIKITATGAGDMAITAEDPGIKLLKKPWESTDGLSTNLSGKKVCDPADTPSSFVHILAGLAGATIATGAPTISNLVYFSIQDKDKKQYWDVLEKVLADFGYVFYFNASGELAFYSLAALTGTPSLVVRSDATILQQTPGDAGIEIKKRFIQYQETVVKYKEAQTIASAVIFRDTTNQGLTDCSIEIAAGGYYPASADASTYAYIDYFLEDGRDILAVGSATADFSLDSGITYEFAHLGKSARIRFYNPTALPKSIRKLKIAGSNVIAVKAESSMTSNEGGGKKLEYQADYLTANADAQSLANLLRYVYANSTSLYTFRSYQGVLYPTDTLYPSDTLYPLGDTLALGSLVNLLDPVWTSLNVNCAIYRKRYKVGKAGATFEALGIGTINLAAATARRPVAVPDARPIVGLYPTEKALASTSDAVDFEGQYGVYLGQRYVGAKPTTWTLDDAGQTATDVAALVPTYTPAYLGAQSSDPTPGYSGQWYLKTSVTRGIYAHNGTAFVRETSPSTAHIATAWPDIVTQVNAGVGSITDYCGSGVNFVDVLGANIAFIQKVFAQYIKIQTGGSIYGGDRYNADGTDNTTTAKGFWIGADGTIKARDIVLEDSSVESKNITKVDGGAYSIGKWNQPYWAIHALARGFALSIDLGGSIGVTSQSKSGLDTYNDWYTWINNYFTGVGASSYTDPYLQINGGVYVKVYSGGEITEQYSFIPSVAYKMTGKYRIYGFKVGTGYTYIDILSSETTNTLDGIMTF